MKFFFNKKQILVIVLIIFLVNILIIGVAMAGPFLEVTEGFIETGSKAGFPSAAERDFRVVWATYISNFAAGVGGAFFAILIIYAGWIWLNARGREEQIEKAKKLIIGATIGLTIIIFARLIAELAINYFGANVIAAG